MFGLTRGSTRAHVVRAVVESMAWQTADVVDAIVAATGHPIAELRVDGGASAMDVLCQFQADVLGVTVRRPATTETTALGAAYLAGIAEGVWASPRGGGGRVARGGGVRPHPAPPVRRASGRLAPGRRARPRLGDDRHCALSDGQPSLGRARRMPRTA